MIVLEATMNANEAAAYSLQVMTMATTFATALAVIISTVLSKLEARKAAIKVAEVKERLETETEDVMASTAKDKGETNGKLLVIHDLVNSNMLEQKRLTMMALKRVAELSKDPKDALILRIATEAYEVHLANQKHIQDAKDKETQ